MNFRFWGKSGHTADITAMIEFGAPDKLHGYKFSGSRF
jgi:hypothetical protein